MKNLPLTPKIATSFAALCLVVAVLFLYTPVGQFDFVSYDDDVYIYQNPHLRNGLTVESFRWAFTSVHASNWHPLTWLSHALDISVFGLKPAGHHWVNLALHALNASLLLLLARSLGLKPLVAAAVAALFALHPLRVESVAWLAERKDLLSATFALLSLLAYLRARQRHKKQWWLACQLFLALGLLAKPMLVTIPCVMLLLDFWPLGRWSPDSWAKLGPLVREKGVLLLLCAASSVVTFLAQRTEAVIELAKIPLIMRIQTIFVAYARYIGASLLPGDQSVLFPYPNAWPLTLVLLSLAFLTGLSLLAWRARNSCPGALAGWLWFLGMLVPVIGLIQVGEQAYANRYTYLPGIGLLLALTVSAKWLIRRYRVPDVVVALIILSALGFFSYRTRVELAHWKNSEHLFLRAIAVTDRNVIALNNLGSVYNDAGRHKDALPLLLQAAQIAPTNAAALNNLGIALVRLNRPQEAIRAYQAALKARPRFADAANNLGDALSDTGEHLLALEWFDKAIAWNIYDPNAHYNRANSLRKLKRPDEAAASYRAAIQRRPGYVKAWNNLAIVLAESAKQDEAASAFARVVELDPTNSSVRHNYSLLLTQRGEHKAAIAQSRTAVRLRPTYHQALDQLATLLLLANTSPAAADAEHFARRAIAQHNRDWRYHFRLAQALQIQGKDYSTERTTAIKVAGDTKIARFIQSKLP